MVRVRAGVRLVSCILAIVGFVASDVFADGLDNPGFESGIAPWIVSSEADSVTVVGTEGAEDSPTYADHNITVVPFIGEQMLRLGSPKQKREKQEVGANTVTQTFASTSDVHIFAFRLFSWDHRQDDVLRFDISGAAGASIVVTDAESGGDLEVRTGVTSTRTCFTIPCEIEVGDGKRDEFLDTGWMQVNISGLPTDGSSITLEYTLVGGGNKAHASWAYFDSVNTPPVAKFDFRGAAEGVDIVEGSLVPFKDQSYDPDPGDRIVSWEWSITGSPIHDPSKIIYDQDPTFVFPNNGNFVVNLTVTDSFGASTTVSSGGLPIDGSPAIASLSVEDYPSLVSALNQEVLTEATVALFGRFIDPGYVDQHTASWDVDGFASLTEAVTESYAIPFSTIGKATADFQAPDIAQTLGAELTITDAAPGGSSASDTFTIEVLDAPVDREPNNDLDLDLTPALESGWVYLSTLDTVDDVDIFEIVLPDADADGTGEPLPAGSEVLVKLKNLPADFDLVVLSYLPNEASTTSWLQTSWLQTSWLQTSWLQTSWLQTSWLQTSWLQTSWLQTPWNALSWLQTSWLQTSWLQTSWLQTSWLQTSWLQTSWLQTGFMDQIALSDLAQAEFGGEDIGGSDLALSEIGLDALDVDGISIAGFSANRGLEQESALVRTDAPGTRIFVAIVGNNGAFSTETYSLQVEASKPVDVEILLGDACTGTPLITNHTADANPLTGSASPRTLFVTQKQRFDAIHGDTAWASIETGLAAMAAFEDFAVLNIDSAIYDNWDSNPCSVEAANDVATSIRTDIADILSVTPSIKYVVFIGSDNIIPFRRVADETAISNEKLYVQDSQLKPGSPLFISMYKGNNLTDDYYVDNQPIQLHGRELYVPKLSVARLVETPEEISSSIAAFVSSGGILNLSSALVTGYDFFQDGAALSADNLLSAISPVDELISDNWDLAELLCDLLGVGGGTCVTHKVNNVNAHYNHYGALTAYGYNNNDFDDYLSSEEIYNSGSALAGSLNYTIGCHSGLSVPDGSAIADSPAANLDFPQAMSGKSAVYVGSTGFGLGDDTAVAGTEKLIAIFSAEVARGGTVGQALVKAKQNYINSLSTISVYDEKSSIQTTMYGLPMYTLGYGAVAAVAQNATLAVSNFDETYNHNEVTTADGSYFIVEGDYQVTAWRPIQPRVVKNVTQNDPSFPVHGVLITGGGYTDTANSDPVISRPKQEWESDTGEPAVCLDAFWPSTLVTVNNLPLLDSVAQSLVLIPGQFRCNSGANSDPVSGTQRNITSLQYELTGSTIADDADFTVPTINEVGLRVTDTGIRVDIDAVDDVAIEKIVMLVFDNDLITSYPVVTNGTGPYTLDAPMISDTAQLMLQVVDTAGNVANWSAKGSNARLIEVDAGSEAVFSTLWPTTLTGTVTDFNNLKSEAPSVFYRWAFGDGTYEFGKLAENGVAVDGLVIDAGTGDASFRVEHQYSAVSNVTATLKVTDALGGIGVDDVTMTFCGDEADLDPSLAWLDYVRCGLSNDSPTVVSLYLEVADLVGSNQFRVHLDLDNDGKDDEMLKYNSGNGSTTGLSSLVVTHVPGDNVVIFTFDLADRGFTGGETFSWYAETQEGVAGGTGQGFVDRMPDAGYFTHIMQ